MRCHSPWGSSSSPLCVNDHFSDRPDRRLGLDLACCSSGFGFHGGKSFSLKCFFFFFLASEMEQLRISPATMLEDEITWLDNFEPNRTAECETSEADNILLAGHLRLIKTLLSLCGAEKEMLGNYCFILSCDRIPHFLVIAIILCVIRKIG